ncbi:hypothetical protein [Brevibacillus invocatus]
MIETKESEIQHILKDCCPSYEQMMMEDGWGYSHASLDAVERVLPLTLGPGAQGSLISLLGEQSWPMFSSPEGGGSVFH